MFKIDGEGSVNGAFVGEDISTGQQPTAVTTEWLNAVQSELVSQVLLNGGVLSPTDSQQTAKLLINALRTMRHTSYATDGTGAAYTLVVPADHLAISSVTDLQLRIKFHAASRANPTLYVVGAAAKNLKQYDATGAKVAAVVAANQVADVVFDGTDFVVLDVLPPVVPTAFVPGMSLRWPSPVPPSGWLIRNGAAVSRVAYAALFAVIGTTFGAGDGSTTFNLPDDRDRMPIGAGNLYGVGATGGSRDAIVVSHTHSATVYDPGHNHAADVFNGGYNSAQSRFSADSWNSATTLYTGTSTTGISVSNSYTGGSGSNANLPPYLADYSIIKY